MPISSQLKYCQTRPSETKGLIISFFLEAMNEAQESDVKSVKTAECQPKWSLSIMKHTRNASHFGSKFDVTVTKNHL